MKIATEPLKDRETINRLLEYLKKTNERNYMLVKVQLNTAIKITDLVNLMVSDFIKKDGSLRSFLRIREKEIAINKELGRATLEYIDNNNLWYTDAFFQSAKGYNKPLEQKQIHRIYAQTAKKLNIPHFNSESLRRTWGYYTYLKTGDLHLVTNVLERSSPLDTLIYIGLEEKTKVMSNVQKTIFNDIEF